MIITVKQAAKLLGTEEGFIKRGLQNGTLPFGDATTLNNECIYRIDEEKLKIYIWLKDKPQPYEELKIDVMDIVDIKMEYDKELNPVVNVYMNIYENGNKEISFFTFKINSGFGIYRCNEFLSSLQLDEYKGIRFTNYENYDLTIKYYMLLISIKKILVERNLDIMPYSVFSYMLDGIRGKNLIDLAKKENDLYKYVIMALNDFGVV